MIRSPIRRLWLYADQGALEILVIGADEEVAPMFARISQASEHWPGFDHVDVVGQGLAVLGLRVTLSMHAHHLDPIAEGLRALSSVVPLSLVWSSGDTTDGRGMVGTW